VAVNDHQFSVRFVALGIALFAIYLGVARLCFDTAVVGLGFVFFLFWFALSFFLLTRPPELNPALRQQPKTKLPLRWRLFGACVAGMAMSLLVMLWAANGSN